VIRVQLMGPVAEVGRLVDKLDGLVRVHERRTPYVSRGASESVRLDLEVTLERPWSVRRGVSR
jgi:hypothetical protein